MYDLTKMEVPTALFWGDNDWLADGEDVKNSAVPNIKNLLGDFEYADFNHLDFLWGLRAPKEVYSKIISMMKDD